MSEEILPHRDPEPLVEKVGTVEPELEPVSEDDLVPSEEYEDPGVDPLCVNTPFHAYHEGQPCPTTE